MEDHPLQYSEEVEKTGRRDGVDDAREAQDRTLQQLVE